MTSDKEAAFLEKWIQPALDGELVNLNAIHMDHMAAIGKKFSLTTTSRLLMRNGWRKITPDTRHPKSDPAIQEDFKKNSQKRWMPPLK
ncbi:MAG: winged helix-turn-helix domain-containing protein [Rickettsiales bacterium]|jgi:hypothetical protein|nr:winged helix-turn-helix domain-containing protein [Rickettsiales bacterium]